MLPAGSEIPSIGTCAGVRTVSRSPRVNATAIGSGDSLVTETSVIPPPSATDQTRCTASPDGMRNRVSTTGVPAVRTWRTAAVGRGRVPSIVGGDVPRQDR